ARQEARDRGPAGTAMRAPPSTTALVMSLRAVVVDRLHDRSSCFDRLSMKLELSWHLPANRPHPLMSVFNSWGERLWPAALVWVGARDGPAQGSGSGRVRDG